MQCHQYADESLLCFCLFVCLFTLGSGTGPSLVSGDCNKLDVTQQTSRVHEWKFWARPHGNYTHIAVTDGKWLALN